MTKRTVRSICVCESGMAGETEAVRAVARQESDATVGVAAAEIAVGQSNALIEGPAEERSEEDGLPQIDC